MTTKKKKNPEAGRYQVDNEKRRDLRNSRAKLVYEFAAVMIVRRGSIDLQEIAQRAT